MDEATGELGGNEPGAPDTWNFSIEVAKAWEEAFFSTPTPRTRKVALRSAMTFSPDPGGVFDVFLSPRPPRPRRNQPARPSVRLLDSRSRLHPRHRIPHRHEDLHRRRQSRLTQIHSPTATSCAPSAKPGELSIGLPTAEWMLEIGTFLMRTESELVLKSRQVVPGRLLTAGFQFTFPHWPEAARDLVARWGRQNLAP